MNWFSDKEKLPFWYLIILKRLSIGYSGGVYSLPMRKSRMSWVMIAFIMNSVCISVGGVGKCLL